MRCYGVHFQIIVFVGLVKFTEFARDILWFTANRLMFVQVAFGFENPKAAATLE